jgi:hypothetical protein
MPTVHDASNMRVAPSTSPDGLDLTVEEARQMPAEEFCRLFGLGSLDDVPLVAPGHLERAPRQCEWYVRHRPAQKNPGPKGRKTPGYELVVKVPQQAAPEVGGAIAVNPKRIGLQAKDPDGARLEALVFLARKSGRRRRATNWPIERIQSLLVRDVLETCRKLSLGMVALGDDDDPRTQKTRETYNHEVNAFLRLMPDLEVGDVGDGLVERYFACPSDRARGSRLSDLFTVRRLLKLGLQELGVPPTYNVHFRIPQNPATQKAIWTVDEYDRLRAAADGYLFEPGGAPKMVPGPDGPVQMRRKDLESREAWRRAIPFLAYTASRHGRLPRTRWVPPEAEPMDGKKLPKRDRPWLEVLDEGIFYHRDGEARCDSKKRRGGNLIPVEFEPTVRAWYEADLANGHEFVFHKRDGSRYVGRFLCRSTFNQIVEDAGIDPERVPHHLKDLAVDWSDTAGIHRDTLAAHADTTPRTLNSKYGNPRQTALLERAAEEITQGAWRVRGARKANVIRLFRDAHARAGVPVPVAAALTAVPRRGVSEI